MNRECKIHSWRIGSFIGRLREGKIIKIGINIFCENCDKKIKAYYKLKNKRRKNDRTNWRPK